MQTKLLTVKEVAERCGVTRRTVYNWVYGSYYTSDGQREYAPGGHRFPEPRKIGRFIRIRESDLNRWLDQVATPAG